MPMQFVGHFSAVFLSYPTSFKSERWTEMKNACLDFMIQVFIGNHFYPDLTAAVSEIIADVVIKGNIYWVGKELSNNADK